MNTPPKRPITSLKHIIKASLKALLHSYIHLAWVFKRKLPSSYDFFFLCSHGVGHNATLGFLHHCGVKINWHHMEGGKARYHQLYSMLLKHSLSKLLARNNTGGGGGDTRARNYVQLAFQNMAL